jgi:hypothetical protein
MPKAHTSESVTKTAFLLIPKWGIRTHNEQQEWCVPVWCGCYRGQAMLRRSFIGTTPTITERVYSVFQSSLNSAWIQPAQLNRMMILRMGQISRQNRHQNFSGNYSLALKKEVSYTHLQQDAEERMTVKHHTSMMGLLNLAFSCCISLRLYHTACSGD